MTSPYLNRPLRTPDQAKADQRENNDREYRAAKALEAYSEAAHGDTIFYDDADVVITDLLTDLLHYCQEYNLDFTRALVNAQGHFFKETTGNG